MPRLPYCFTGFHFAAFPSLFPYQWPLSRGGGGEGGRNLQRELVILFINIYIYIAPCQDKNLRNTFCKIRNQNTRVGGGRFFVRLPFCRSLSICQMPRFLIRLFCVSDLGGELFVCLLIFQSAVKCYPTASEQFGLLVKKHICILFGACYFQSLSDKKRHFFSCPSSAHLFLCIAKEW